MSKSAISQSSLNNGNLESALCESLSIAVAIEHLFVEEFADPKMDEAALRAALEALMRHQIDLATRANDAFHTSMKQVAP